VPPLTVTQMVPALQDAMSRLTPLIVDEGRIRKDFRTTLQSLANDPERKDTQCRLLLMAWNILNRLDEEDDPATRPDRAAIRLVLGLTCHCLRRS